MQIKLYNTLTRKKEIFRPLRKDRVGLYTCGPTVYNYAHIGNLRTYIFEDVLRRTLEYAGYKVRQVMNITDVEDKIIRDAQKSGQTIFEFVKPYEKAFFEDLQKLNIEKAWKYPRATDHIKGMIALARTLLKKGLAYQSGG
jgi:cysteinyl-tRNA synthetase